MSIYSIAGETLQNCYSIQGNVLPQAYDINGNELLDSWVNNLPDSGYSFTDGIETYNTKLMFNFGTASFQSVTMGNGKFYRASTDEKVYPYGSDLSALNMITLPSTGGHKNDGCYYDGKIYWLDGTASSSKALFVWDITANTISEVTVPIPDNANGSKRVVAGICNTDVDGIMYLVSRDQYNNSDIDHQTGDKMCVYEYNVSNNTVELVASFDWDCVYVQGATYVDGKIYVVCNTQTTGSASNYTGITIKVIDTDSWAITKTLTCSGSFEPQGCDHIVANSIPYFWFGISKSNTLSKVVVMRAL